MSSLRDRAARSRAAQQYDRIGDNPEPPPEPKTKPAKTKTKAKAKTKAPKGSSTGNQQARQTAGVTTTSPMTRAEQQAQRRQNLAQLSVEIPTDRKAELLAAAANNGRTLKDEVLARLFPD